MTNYDIIIAGAGAGGICAAIAAARTGAKTLLIEKAPEIGGTGVHSPVSLICKFHGTDHRPTNLGIHRELFLEVYAYSTRDRRPSAPRLTYDETVLLQRYKALTAAEPLLELRTGIGVSEVIVDGRRIQNIRLEDGSELSAKVYIDGTADGVLGSMAGCRHELGRTVDGAMQSATLVFGVSGVAAGKLNEPDYSTRGGLDSLWKELTPLLHAAQESGQTKNPRRTVVAFPYPDGKRLLFNSNAMLGVDPTQPGNVEAAIAAGRQQIDELVQIIRQHPAFANCAVDFVASKLGVREGRRILGDYVLTEEDCLGEARFDDMLCACAYELDIHDPAGGDARMVDIPGSGYYHIPQRSLIAADLDNMLMGSRCISGSHEAHSSYRVISGVTAIGQAAGTLAALAARADSNNIRETSAEEVRYVLREQVQFVEGETRQPDNWQTRAV